MAVLSRWWNGAWGTVTQQRIRLELASDGRYHVYWGGPAWEDGHLWRVELADAEAAVNELIAAAGGNWRRTDYPA